MGLSRILAAAGLLPVAGTGLAVYMAWPVADEGPPSVCYGNIVNGRLEGGRRLPYVGKNYRAYSFLLFVLGRTYMHSAVRDATRDAYAELARTHPDLRFVYAESGWPSGGRFPPHRTHANGTSVDFHVPVRTADGQVSELSTTPFNLYGYGVDFDDRGQAGSLRLDFEAMAAHLLALDKAARAHGIGIRRVIFDPRLRHRLAATKTGAIVTKRLRFNRRQVWWRHDEHYHVDFAVPCK